MKVTSYIITVLILFPGYIFAQRENNVDEYKDLIRSDAMNSQIRLKVMSKNGKKRFAIEKCNMIPPLQCSPFIENYLPISELDPFFKSLAQKIKINFENKRNQTDFDFKLHAGISAYGAAYLGFSRVKPASGVSVRGGAWWLVLGMEILGVINAIDQYTDLHYLNGELKTVETYIIENSDQELNIDEIKNGSEIFLNIYMKSLEEAWSDVSYLHWS